MVSLANRDPFGLRCALCHGLPQEALCPRCGGTGKGPGAPPSDDEIKSTLRCTLVTLNEMHARISTELITSEFYIRVYNLRAHIERVLERMR